MLEALRTQPMAPSADCERPQAADNDRSHAFAKTPVVSIPGDGIGPDVTAAARRVIDAAFPHIEWVEAAAGKSAFEGGEPSGVPDDTLQAIAKTGLALKGPLETGIGTGGKSANVTLRKSFELYANLRPVRELPGVRTRFSGLGIDLVIVRENVEDLYAGIEYMQTPEVAQCLKLISRTGSEKITRLAFEFARASGRERVTCATKANIMKLTEGLFKRVFEEVSGDYPEITTAHQVIDNCAQQLVMAPEQFDVIVTTNMNGDIISDLAAGLVGGVGLAPSANIGHDVAMFEAVHGTAPDLAGQNVANPVALILAGAMMLRHIGAVKAANGIEHALDRTLEQGRYLTADIADGFPAVSTDDFASAVIDGLGHAPKAAAKRHFRLAQTPKPGLAARHIPARTFDGIDVFVEWGQDVDTLSDALRQVTEAMPFRLDMISNRGVMMYPRAARASTVNHWRCRFVHDGKAHKGRLAEQQAICTLLGAISSVCMWMHVERLQSFDGEPAYTRAQGQ